MPAVEAGERTSLRRVGALGASGRRRALLLLLARRLGCSLEDWSQGGRGIGERRKSSNFCENS